MVPKERPKLGNQSPINQVEVKRKAEVQARQKNIRCTKR
jgi:hypothetical protein